MIGFIVSGVRSAEKAKAAHGVPNLQGLETQRFSVLRVLSASAGWSGQGRCSAVASKPEVGVAAISP